MAGVQATRLCFSGNATGVYSTSIPLNLPAERAGLPLRLQIGYGQRSVGAAGLGWDIRFSYIQRARTFAHRRPAYRQHALPQPHERTGGELIPAGDRWHPHGDTPLRRTGRTPVRSWPMMGRVAPIPSRNLRSSGARALGCSGRSAPKAVPPLANSIMSSPLADRRRHRSGSQPDSHHLQHQPHCRLREERDRTDIRQQLTIPVVAFNAGRQGPRPFPHPHSR